jgi:hypothetical protein
MERAHSILQLGILSLTLGACSSTAILSSWRAPDVGRISFNRVLVHAPLKEPSLRRSAEDTLAGEIKNAHGVPSYTLISAEEMGDYELVRRRAVEGGFDGLVVFRVVSVDKQATWVPGAAWGGYHGGWMYDPGYVQVDTLVRVEANVHAVADDKLVWASASQTTNPSSVSRLAASVAHAVARKMRKEGLIP